MDEIAQARLRAFRVNFRRLQTWSVAAQFTVDWNWPDEVIRPLASILRRRNETALESLTPDSKVTLLTIRFDGSIEPREPVRIKDIKGRLFRVYPGDVVFSKIDVRNGAIGLAPDGIDCMCVTSEFPVYSVNFQKTDSGYVKLLFRTITFKKQLNSMISGTSGRKRIQPTQLEGVKVPVPPLLIQQKIVAHWEAAQASSVAAKVRAAKIEEEMQKQFLADLELSNPKRSIPPKYFAVNWKGFERWSVSYNQAAMSVIDLTLGRYSVVELGSILEMVQYGTSEKANTTEKGILVLRMNNIKNGYLDYTNLKHVLLSEKSRESLLLMDGDILFNRTNSKELVGKCAVFHSSDEYVFASYLIRIRLEKDQAIPDYVAYCINSVIGRKQIDVLSRQIIGQANINSQELCSLHIPLPPIDIQKKIMERIESDRIKIVKQMETANHLHNNTQNEVEKMILGTLPVEED
ncbi:MAG: restriction endonuclease subunit S [Sphaerochaeta sp.]|uniref:restriction endonuclease subunit S n=1 Tax=Sphaerochaeta sp. TaxID=1972642 RepID=UPI003D1237EC